MSKFVFFKKFSLNFLLIRFNRKKSFDSIFVVFSAKFSFDLYVYCFFLPKIKYFQSNILIINCKYSQLLRKKSLIIKFFLVLSRWDDKTFFMTLHKKIVYRKIVTFTIKKIVKNKRVIKKSPKRKVFEKKVHKFLRFLIILILLLRL